MAFTEMSCGEFAERLASKDSVPGGGGAAALVGALGASLASMVCNLTIGKKKYAHVEAEVLEILHSAEMLRVELLEQIDGDAKGFEPLAAAYSIPKDDPARDGVMEEALRTACRVPVKIISGCAQILELLDELAEKGSVLALSDVGCGAQLCRAAALSAWVSFRINTRDMKDREYAQRITNEVEPILTFCRNKSEEIYDRVLGKM